MLFCALGVPRPGTAFAVQQLTRAGETSGSTEILLSGSDWKLGCFPMGEGELNGAYKPGFDDSSFRTVTVPGEVQLQTGLKGKDLFLQSKALNLINNQEWWYRKNFVIPQEASGKLVRLELEGADYFSTVWLNGEKVAEHEGAYEGFSIDASKHLKLGAENTLAVRVTCPWLPPGRSMIEYLKSSFYMALPGFSNDIPKPPYFMGGVWGGIPVYGNASLTMGLFRDVRLRVSEPVVIEDLFAHTSSLNADGSATLEITGNAKNYREQHGQVDIGFALAPANFPGEAVRVPGKTLVIHPGDNRFRVEAVVSKPRLWWTWNLGPQNLYRLRATLAAGAGGLGDTQRITLGIRTITRDEHLTYRLNGKRVFLKGVWYPIGDYYASRTTRQMYDRDLRLLKATYSNHIVTQVVEKPDFYELCDELGLFVFVQLPFSQFGPVQVLEASNPRREPFIKNSLEQVRGIVVNLRTHPSIVQWSPFAEARMSGKWFGPQEGYDHFINLAEKLIRELSPDTIFHPSLCDLGEQHMWNGNYRQYSRFQPLMVSEYGEISPPVFETFKEALTPDQMWSARNIPRLFNLPIDIQAYMYWNAWEYSDVDFGVFPMLQRAHLYIDRNISSARQLIDAIQLHHAFMLEYPTEAFRRKMYAPINGIRTWAFRDIYPGTQFGMVDSNGIPKMNYYFYKRGQQPLAISFAYEPALESQVSGKHLHIPVWIANEYRRRLLLDVRCEILTPKGEVVWNKSFGAEASADTSQQVGVVDWLTPDAPGVYILRGQASEKNGDLVTINATYIKVTPRVFAKTYRVLLIGWARFIGPIAALLDGMGASVDVINEASLDRLSELKNADALRNKYDVMWLGPLDHFWKLVEPQIGDGVAEAVRHGLGFIHTGGDAAFHGGAARGACLELTRLAELLPVQLRTQNEDVVYPAYQAGQELPPNLARIKDIQVVDAAWTDAGLKDSGLTGFNQVDPKPEGRVVLTVEGHPLLATGQYGRGRAVAFTGFTPLWEAPGADFLDEEFVNLPVTRAYFGLFAQMLAAATGDRPSIGYAEVLTAREKPLFQVLKELPAANLKTVSGLQAKANGKRAEVSIDLANGPEYARLIRLRGEWDGPQPYLSLYSDNYIDLLPGEKKSISLELAFPNDLTTQIRGRIVIEGSNLAASEIPIVVNP
jgi:beta-mannosidase